VGIHKKIKNKKTPMGFPKNIMLTSMGTVFLKSPPAYYVI
jgi:hypothetical protein